MAESDWRENMRRRGINISPEDVLTKEEAWQTASAVGPIFVKQAKLLRFLYKAFSEDGEIVGTPWQLPNKVSKNMGTVLPFMLMAVWEAALRFLPSRTAADLQLSVIRFR
jgi:hypothetical protein